MRAANSATTSTAGRRAQPVRQTRTNPPRSSVRGSGPFGSARLSTEGADHSHNERSSPGFFPAVMHFTDCMSALPQEVVRHFTLLREVDAKAYGPERSLRELATMAMNTPPPNRVELASTTDAGIGHSTVANHPTSASSPKQDGSGTDKNATESQTGSMHGHSQEDGTGLARRQLFFNLRYVLTELLMTLDEKNHVISTATDALHKQLSRADSSFPYIDNEISEEARYGSLSHWAYSDKHNGKTSGAPGERTRRDIAAGNTLAAAAAALSEEGAASRSEMRREAMLARRGRTQATDLGLGNGQLGRHRDIASSQPVTGGVLARKGNGNPKSRKAGDAPSSSIGLAITNGTTAADAPPKKRRKTETTGLARLSAAGTAVEASTTDLRDADHMSRNREAGSPSATSVAETGRKRPRGGATAVAASRKRWVDPYESFQCAVAKSYPPSSNNASAAPSPRIASSPLTNTFTITNEVPASSPVPMPAQRPGSVRGRQNSAQSLNQEMVSNGRMRPSSSASNKLNNTNGASASGVDPEDTPLSTNRTPSEPKNTVKAASKPPSEQPVEPKNGRGNGDAAKSGNGGMYRIKDPSDKPSRREDTDGNGSNTTQAANPTTTRGGSKSSKTSTPVSATFPELHRSRSSRGGGGNGGVEHSMKRSHKKGAGVITAQQPTSSSTTAVATDPAGGVEDRLPTGEGVDDEDEQDNDNGGGTEPRYCYCNQVSYGSMVACDAKDCTREWFHLSCVGLTKAPGKNGSYIILLPSSHILSLSPKHFPQVAKQCLNM